MGTFILWFGWFSFNSGSTASIMGKNIHVAAKAYVSTLLSPVFASVTCVIVGLARHHYHAAFGHVACQEL